MAKATFIGDVRGYSVGDDGRIWLTIDELEPSAQAQQHIHDLVKEFNPASGRHGFGSRDVPCAVKPGFASYRVTLTKEEANGITMGSVVELTVDFYYARRVVFLRGRDGKQGRWGAIPEMLHQVISVKAASTMHSGSSRSGRNSESSGAASGGGGSGNK